MCCRFRQPIGADYTDFSSTRAQTRENARKRADSTSISSRFAPRLARQRRWRATTQNGRRSPAPNPSPRMQEGARVGAVAGDSRAPSAGLARFGPTRPAATLTRARWHRETRQGPAHPTPKTRRLAGCCVPSTDDRGSRGFVPDSRTSTERRVLRLCCYESEADFRRDMLSRAKARPSPRRHQH
jgi:hypothetical protein